MPSFAIELSRSHRLNLELGKSLQVKIAMGGTAGCVCDELPPPQMSVPSGQFVMGVQVYIVRPPRYPEMLVYYYLDGNFSDVKLYRDEVFDVSTDTSFTVWGKLPFDKKGRMTRFSYNKYTVGAGEYNDTFTLQTVSTLGSDEVEFQLLTPIEYTHIETFDIGSTVNEVLGFDSVSITGHQRDLVLAQDLNGYLLETDGFLVETESD